MLYYYSPFHIREEGADLTPTEKSKKLRDNIKNDTKNFAYTPIADLRRSVGVTAVTPLVWLNWFTSAQPFH